MSASSPPTGNKHAWGRPVTITRAILVCIVAILCFTGIAITGMLSRTLTEGTLVMILGLIAAIAGIGAGVHLAGAPRLSRRED